MSSVLFGTTTEDARIVANRQDSTGDPVLGARLREIRERCGWSQREVEVRSGGEIKQSILSAYERGVRALSVPRLLRLAEIYGVSAVELLEPNGAPNARIGPTQIRR